MDLTAYNMGDFSESVFIHSPYKLVIHHYGLHSIEKQGDNALGSVCLSARQSLDLFIPQLLSVRPDGPSVCLRLQLYLLSELNLGRKMTSPEHAQSGTVLMCIGACWVHPA